MTDEQTTAQGSTDSIMSFLRSARRFDPGQINFQEFSQALHRRLTELGMSSDSEYIDLLQARPSEFNELFNHLRPPALFADPEPYRVCLDRVIPSLVQQEGPVRIWVPDCGIGNDAYAIAIMLLEAIGPQRFQERVKIFATDTDEDKLKQARQVRYSRADVALLSDETIQKYFQQQETTYILRPEYRRLIVFGKHDIVEDAPIANLDFVCWRYAFCRLDLDRQKTALRRLRFGLKTNACFLIGTGEVILPGHGFTVDESPVLYRNNQRPNFNLFHAVADPSVDSQNPEASFVETLFETSSIAHLVIDLGGYLCLANARARLQFKISADHLGKALQEFEVSYKPLELRSLIEKLGPDEKSVVVSGVPCPTAFGTVLYDVHIRKLSDKGETLGISIQYVDVTAFVELDQKVKSVNEQLDSANEELQSAHEELITTNEELQSTNEELETTNEELQSTNEELETMNEELQSTNSDLEATNLEQSLLTDRIEETNRFLETILGSMQTALIVLNNDFNVLVWNKQAADLFGPRPEEAHGKAFFSLDMGLPLEDLQSPIHKMMGSHHKYEETIVDAVSRTGKAMRCKIGISSFDGSNGCGLVLIANHVKEK